MVAGKVVLMVVAVWAAARARMVEAVWEARAVVEAWAEARGVAI